MPCKSTICARTSVGTCPQAGTWSCSTICSAGKRRKFQILQIHCHSPSGNGSAFLFTAICMLIHPPRAEKTGHFSQNPPGKIRMYAARKQCSCTVEKQRQKHIRTATPHHYSVSKWSSNTRMLLFHLLMQICNFSLNYIDFYYG